MRETVTPPVAWRRGRPHPVDRPPGPGAGEMGAGRWGGDDDDSLRAGSGGVGFPSGTLNPHAVRSRPAYARYDDDDGPFCRSQLVPGNERSCLRAATRTTTLHDALRPHTEETNQALKRIQY
ncbi:unnamed protein product [Arctogadus glacialis]